MISVKQRSWDVDSRVPVTGILAIVLNAVFHQSPNIRGFALYCPLIAAIFAPLATLLDIPALTEHWYDRDGQPQPDPTVSLILSAVGLFLNFLANALLLLRFTSRASKRWKLFTTLSLISWGAKTAVALANLVVFGILVNNSPDYSYSSGFWCAVVSVIISGVITLALILHYFVSFGRNDSAEVRMQGRKFMLSVTLFITILAIQALAFCKIEEWAYSDAIYFSVQTALTIGFGDYAPTTTAGKVLVFVFSILTISQLGNEISMIISFMSSHADIRRERWRKKYETEIHKEANDMRPHASLKEEIALIQRINQREDFMRQTYDLVWSVLSLVIFWVVGAAIFSSIEGWTYGNGLYMVMILSLTIGFGDFTPEQPAGKIIFIVYALMAVPIVTSFAVQTITGLLSTFSDRREIRERLQRITSDTPDALHSHSDLIDQARGIYENMRPKLLQLSGKEKRDSVGETPESEGELIEKLMELVVRLEIESRDIILGSMEKGVPRTVLLADRNVQVRNVKTLRGDDANVLQIWRGVEREQADQPDDLAAVKRYRHTFAQILVIGGILKKLHGPERDMFERWRKTEKIPEDGTTGLQPAKSRTSAKWVFRKRLERRLSM